MCVQLPVRKSHLELDSKSLLLGYMRKYVRQGNFNEAVRLASQVLVLDFNDNEARTFLKNRVQMQFLCINDGPGDFIVDITHSSDGRYIAVLSYDRTVRIFDTRNFQQVRVIADLADMPQAISYSPDGKMLAYVCSDKLMIYDTAKTTKKLEMKGFGICKDVSWSPDNKYVAVGGSSGFSIANVEKKDITFSEEKYRTVEHISWSIDGRYIVFISTGGLITIFDFSNKEVLGKIERKRGYFTALSFNPDGKFFAIGFVPKELGYTIEEMSCIEIYRIDNGYADQIATLTGHEKAITALSWSSDGKCLVSSSEDNTVRIWDISQKKEVRRLDTIASQISCINWLPGSDIIVGCKKRGRTTYFWDPNDGNVIRTINARNGSFTSVAFNPKRPILATGSNDMFVRLWDIDKNVQMKPLSWHSPILAVTWSHNGQYIAAGAETHNIVIWNIDNPDEYTV